MTPDEQVNLALSRMKAADIALRDYVASGAPDPGTKNQLMNNLQDAMDDYTATVAAIKRSVTSGE